MATRSGVKCQDQLETELEGGNMQRSPVEAKGGARGAVFLLSQLISNCQPLD